MFGIQSIVCGVPSASDHDAVAPTVREVAAAFTAIDDYIGRASDGENVAPLSLLVVQGYGMRVVLLWRTNHAALNAAANKEMRRLVELPLT